MGRSPCCPKEGINRGAWTAEEDRILVDYIKAHGEGKWRRIPKEAGLKRSGKSCRLRWLNYLRPDIKRGNITLDEEDLIIRLHKLLGNRWSLIAGRLPGRTDNEIKNYWNTNLSKRAQAKLSKNPKIQEKPTKSASHTDDPPTRPTPIRVKAVRCADFFHSSSPPATESDSSDVSFSNNTGLSSPNEELTRSNFLRRFDVGEMSLSEILASDMTKFSDSGVRDDGDFILDLFSAEETEGNWVDSNQFRSLASFLESDEWIM